MLTSQGTWNVARVFYLIASTVHARLTIQSHKGIWKENKRDEMKHVKGGFKGGFKMIKSHDYEGKLGEMLAAAPNARSF